MDETGGSRRRGTRRVLLALSVAVAAGFAPPASAPVSASPTASPAPVPQNAPFDSLRALLWAGRFRDAIAMATELVRSIEGSPEADSLRLARALDLETESLLRQGRGRSEAAVLAAERALGIKARAAAPDSVELGISLRNLSGVRIVQGDCAQAMRLADQAVGLHSRAGAAASLELARSLDARASAHALCGDGPAVESDLRAAQAIYERRLGKVQPAVADCMERIGLRRMSIGDCRAARSLVAEAGRIRRAVLPARHPDLVVARLNEAWLKAEYENELQALGVFDAAVAEIESTLGPDHPLLADALLAAGTTRGLRGDIERAREQIHRAFRIVQSTYGPEHPSLAAFARDEAISLSIVGENDSALVLLRATVRNIERVGNPYHPYFLQVLSPYSDELVQAGLRQEADRQARRALEIAERVCGPESPRLAFILGTLASHAMEDGDPLTALTAAQRLLKVVEGNPCATTDEQVSAFETLGETLVSLGEYEQAQEWLEKAIAVSRTYRGTATVDATKGMTVLARVRRALGDLEGARALDQEALALLEKMGAQRSSRTVRLLFDLAEIQLDLGDYAAAQSVYDRAIRVYIGSVLGENHPAAKLGITNLKSVLHGPEGESTGMPRYRAALGMLEAMVGPDHEAAVLGQQALGRVLIAEDEPAAALEALLRADVAARRRFRTAVTGLSERRALRYAQTRRQDLGRILSLVGDSLGSQADFVARAWDGVVGSRGLVMEAVTARVRSLHVEPDTSIAHLNGALAEARQRLSALWIRGPQAESFEVFQARLRTAAEAVQRDEEALAERSPLFRQELQRGSLGIREVSAAMPESSALVGIVRYAHFPSFDARSDGERYVAFLLGPGQAEPLRINLGDADVVDAAVTGWRKAVLSPGARPDAAAAEAACRRAGERLRALVWDPITGEIAGARRVFVVPDGALCLVNLAALPGTREGYLVEEGPTIHLLSSERDLVPSPVDSVSGSGLLALGDPDFDRGGPLATRAAVGVRGAETDSGAGEASEETRRAPRTECAAFRSLRWDPLPWTRREVEDVVSSVSDTTGTVAASPGTGEATTLLAESGATERNLRRSAPGKRLLHLATHGFFLGKGCRGGVYRTRGLGGLMDAAPEAVRAGESENPLLLSGLVLAGANRRSPATPGDDDGILTGEEIATLDLSGVEWAVLSACETGVGEVRAGEGVFGLQRGFRMAGARTVVMSLWSVEDRATREWMKALYDARIHRGETTMDAVREASLACLLHRRRAGQSTHPFYWGAFVAAGGWR